MMMSFNLQFQSEVGPPMSQVVNPIWGEDASADRFDVAPVGTVELDAERDSGVRNWEEYTDVLQRPVVRRIGKAGGALRDRTVIRRRPKAGHYPFVFSPYLMSAGRRGDMIALGRVMIK